MRFRRKRQKNTELSLNDQSYPKTEYIIPQNLKDNGFLCFKATELSEPE